MNIFMYAVNTYIYICIYVYICVVVYTYGTAYGTRSHAHWLALPRSPYVCMHACMYVTERLCFCRPPLVLHIRPHHIWDLGRFAMCHWIRIGFLHIAHW